MAILDVVPVARKFEDRTPANQPISEYAGIDPGGRPITAAEQKIRKDREKYVEPWAEPIGGALQRAWRRVGDKFIPGGAPLMNAYRKKEKQKAAQEISFEKKMALRRQILKMLFVRVQQLCLRLLLENIMKQIIQKH